MSSLQKEPKIYGAVESQSFITFTGFCKRIYDPTQQSVDVFIDDVKIDTILANQKIRDIENKYEVFDTNGFCFTYQLPKEYIGKKHKLEFKTQEGEQLLHSPTHTIDQFSPLYNQVIFIESLKEPLKYSAIDNGYTKNALSFIAIEENLSDEGFIEFVLEMCKKYKELSLSIFYFNEHQKHQATKVFSQVKQKNFFNPSSVQEIIKSSEIYLHNVVDEFRFTLNEEYYNKVKNVQAIKENLFTIELTRKAKKKKAMVEMEVDTVTPIMFETSVISEMFKEDERYQEFVFMNSLGRVDEAKIKDMYCPNSIGFLATKENLEDEAFMGYIKELMERFPEAEFKGCCFNKNNNYLFKRTFSSISNIQFFEIQDVKELLSEIEIYIFNWNSKKDIKLIKLQSIIRAYSNKIVVQQFDSVTRYDGICNFDARNIHHFYIQNYKYYGFSEQELLYSERKLSRLWYGVPLLRISEEAADFNHIETINDLMYANHIGYILNNKNYKNHFINIDNKYFASENMKK